MREMQPLLLPNLTRYEADGLNAPFNLADGHAHQSLTPAQKSIVQRLPEIFREARRLPQQEVEASFTASFFRGAGESPAAECSTFLCYSASQATDVVGAVLARRGLTTMVLHPGF